MTILQDDRGRVHEINPWRVEGDSSTYCARRVRAMFTGGTDLDFESIATGDPVDRRDAALMLSAIYEINFAPIEQLNEHTLRSQNHPALASLRWRLEQAFVQSIREREKALMWQLPNDPVAALRIIATRDQVPVVYHWVAEKASMDEIKEFVALEGGPDGGFDDLVAICQVGLSGEAKLELGRNYWDEMGRGSLQDVHTELHRKLTKHLAINHTDPFELPLVALERSLLGGLLASNRYLQPEMIGALGMIELQAGPRCRKVVAGLERLGAGNDALHFYKEHAIADPRHGKDWMDNVVATLGKDERWAPGIIRGALWRSLLNGAFLDALAQHFDVQ